MAEAAEAGFATVDEFLAWEAKQEERFEFVGGVVRMMAGGSANHDLLTMNMGGLLRDYARARGCRVHGTMLKVRSPLGAIMYPDCFIRCGPHKGDVTVVDDPVMVAEVLSPSTEQHDLTRKRWAYQAIPTLEMLLFVDAETARVEMVTRDGEGTWRSRIVEGFAARIALPSENLVLALADLYEGTDLASGMTPSP